METKMISTFAGPEYFDAEAFVERPNLTPHLVEMHPTKALGSRSERAIPCLAG